ncbi:MAG TPA: hypothetical protein VNE40_00440 [Candidatus Dormibacteraeota bacterium]|nr:hypothetical protein [Candidatus Dormibacteraeota bacterium]
MDATEPILPALPKWISLSYITLAAVTIPWTVYLGFSLPTHQIYHNWDVAWAGLDVGIIIALLLNGIFSYLESKWLVLSGTATSTLLIVDAWFDIVSARPGRPLKEAVILALLIELPLALITFWVALKLVKREHLTIKNS